MDSAEIRKFHLKWVTLFWYAPVGHHLFCRCLELPHLRVHPWKSRSWQLLQTCLGSRTFRGFGEVWMLVTKQYCAEWAFFVCLFGFFPGEGMFIFFFLLKLGERNVRKAEILFDRIIQFPPWVLALWLEMLCESEEFMQISCPPVCFISFAFHFFLQLVLFQPVPIFTAAPVSHLLWSFRLLCLVCLYKEGNSGGGVAHSYVEYISHMADLYRFWSSTVCVPFCQILI